ncbi:MAG: vWA domain-containing protein [Polyangia bacterium]
MSRTSSARRLAIAARLAGLAGLLLSLSVSVRPALAAKCPNVHIVLDRSGSMDTIVQGTGKTRMQVANDAVKAILTKYDGKFPIGLSRFPRSGCDSEVISPPAYKSKAKIEASLTPTTTGSTPSGTAMRDAITNIKELHDPERKQYIVLITDGGPGCGGAPDTCPGTVTEIQKGTMQNPPISTFVVGFGGGLSSSEQQCLTQMADAGGKPDMTPLKYYKADSADELNKALSSIVEVVIGGEVGMSGPCDDTCYSNGCPTPGDICVAGECNANPCTGVNCGPGQYCYTDGTSPGTCVKACTKSCPTGSRCLMGACAADPCVYACQAGLVCDANLKRCVKDPLCGNMPADEQCKGTSQCRGGKCVDDPCRYVRCPANTRCVNWEGTCDVIPNPPPMVPDMGDSTVDTDDRRGGCSALPGAAGGASLGSALFAGLFFLAARRRRR